MIISFKDKNPSIHESCFIAENSTIIGNVTLNESVNIWFGAVVRGDINKITIGKGSNIQDNCTLHVNSDDNPIEIGEYVTVGHNAIIHGCKIGNQVLIGMGSIIMDNAEIGDNTIIGAGCLVPPGKKIPSGVLCVGSPVKIVRELSADEIKGLKLGAEHYVQAANEYKID